MLNSAQKELYELLLDKSSEWAESLGLKPEQALEVCRTLVKSIELARSGENIQTITDAVLSDQPQPMLDHAEQVFVLGLFAKAINTGGDLSEYRMSYLFTQAARALEATSEMPVIDALRSIGLKVYDRRVPKGEHS